MSNVLNVFSPKTEDLAICSQVITPLLFGRSIPKI